MALYNFPKFKYTRISSSDDVKRRIYKEQCTVQIINALFLSGFKLEDFTPNTAREIWKIASFMAEERSYHI